VDIIQKRYILKCWQNSLFHCLHFIFLTILTTNHRQRIWNHKQ